MASNQFLHSFPDSGQPASYDGANFNVYLNANKNEKVDKFTLYDDITNFHAIPKARYLQRVKHRFLNPATQQWLESIRDYYFYVIPKVSNNKEARDCARYLFKVHDGNGNSVNPQIIRPEGKKAYLSNISFQVFDGHELYVHRLPLPDGINNPSLQIIPLDSNNNEISVESIRKTNIFGNVEEVGISLFAYSTQNPPYDNEYVAMWKLYLENLHNYQNQNILTLTSEGVHLNNLPTEISDSNYRVGVEHSGNLLRSTAVKANWYGGIISDWLRNNFELTIIGKQGNDFVKILWDSKGRTQLNDINKTSSYEKQSDEPLNQMLNNIDIEIPSNVNNIQVQGIRPYYFTQVVIDNEDLRMANSTGIYTIVTFPIKIQIGVTYK